MNTNTFGEVIYAYTRSQAVADGVQVEVTKTAQEAGISFPVFLTRTVWDNYVAVPEGVSGQPLIYTSDPNATPQVCRAATA